MTDPRVCSVYLHVPFCARQCGYCDFPIAVGSRPDSEGWLTAVSREWEQRIESVPVAEQLETLYVGGGTPSMLGGGFMARLHGVLGTARLAGANLEWTAEANPESLTGELAHDWRRAGVTRVSVGVQSFHEPTLRWMGRAHGPEGAHRALAHVSDTKFRSATLDLIFGVPGSLGRSWSHDLETAVASQTPHISLYGLTVEPNTPLHKAVASGRAQAIDDAQYEDEYLEASVRLTAEGYEHYEVSNFALPGHRSAHNQRYWSGHPYLGLGNGAHSFLPPVRSWNVRAWNDYRNRTAEGLAVLEESEVVEGESARMERLWLGLRHENGVDTAEIQSARLERWLRAGHAEVREGRVRLTAPGWLLLDQLAVDAATDPATRGAPQTNFGRLG